VLRRPPIQWPPPTEAVNPMRQRRRATIDDLRLAIDSLPRATRIAMLEGIQSSEIIAGAYSDANGICPMLAAHRAGGRTSCISFADAWDRFAFRGVRKPSPRRATARELLVLRSHLEASLLEDEAPVLGDDRDRAGDRPGDEYRDRELRSHPGWAWTRVVRTQYEYERVLDRLASEHRSAREPECAS
jgi:hypothetical protein